MKMIVIGSSSGGLGPTKFILTDLPELLDAAILIVRHCVPGGPSLLAPILSEHCSMPVCEASNNLPIRPGHVYVTPPGITVTMKENAYGDPVFLVAKPSDPDFRFRPSIDQALISAANLFREDCIGVVLSGYLDDGSKGAIRIDRVDGTIVVQSPEDAMQPSMPMNVIIRDHPDFVVPEIEIGALLEELVSEIYA